ncbi:GFA family protein [Paraburkholderia podalyriae]|nr:GFA family protein [Paraburkholderia podalyriae]
MAGRIRSGDCHATEGAMLKGRCFCREVRYEVLDIPFDSTVCHCADCRRASAAPFVAWFSVKRSEFRFVHGEPRSFASSKAVLRTFCPDCGTQLTYQHDDFPDEIDITTCSLDVPDLVPPEHHTWTSRKLPWVHVSDALPKHEGSYSKT